MKKNRILLLTIFYLFAIQTSFVYGQDTIRIKDAIWYPSSSKITERGEQVVDSVLNIVKQKPFQKIEVVVVEYINSKSSRCYARPRAKSIMNFFINGGIKEEGMILTYNCEIRDGCFLDKNALPYLFSIVHY